MIYQPLLDRTVLVDKPLPQALPQRPEGRGRNRDDADGAQHDRDAPFWKGLAESFAGLSEEAQKVTLAVSVS